MEMRLGEIPFSAPTAAAAGCRFTKTKRDPVPPRNGSSADFPSPMALDSRGSDDRNTSARSRFALVIAQGEGDSDEDALRGDANIDLHRSVSFFLIFETIFAKSLLKERSRVLFRNQTVYPTPILQVP
jgi:hypothetical protein